MKKTIFFLGMLVLLFSCKKGNNSNATTSSSPANTTSMYDPSSQLLYRDTFVYDANQNLTKRTYHSYDTFALSGGGSLTNIEYGTYTFAINPATQLPSSYTLVWFEAGVTADPIAETHNLFFDNQGRLTKDTLVAGGAANLQGRTATYYAYSGNTIICKVYDMYALVDDVNLIYGYGLSYTDTITVNNGNMISLSKTPLSNNDTSTRNSNYDYALSVNGYSGYSNPFYNPRLSPGLGAFFLNEGRGVFFLDCLSKNLHDGTTWVTDAKGRVVSGTDPGGAVTSFTYNN